MVPGEAEEEAVQVHRFAGGHVGPAQFELAPAVLPHRRIGIDETVAGFGQVQVRFQQQVQGLAGGAPDPHPAVAGNLVTQFAQRLGGVGGPSRLRQRGDVEALVGAGRPGRCLAQHQSRQSEQSR